ncbi:MAG: hypothetical protein R3C31_14925 [Hyphomonadaceae bacterium]
MPLETFFAVWERLTPAAVLLMGAYAIVAALLAMLVSWLRPRWRSTTVVAATSLPIPLILIVLAIWMYLETAADTRPWWQFDKAEGFAAAYWFGAIIAPPALLLGVIGASGGIAILRRLKANR